MRYVNKIHVYFIHWKKLESFRPKKLSQIDSQIRVNLTQIFSNYSESLVEF